MGQSNSPCQFGFLSVLPEDSGYLGGYLVTNRWGRPLEFRLSTAVKPNRVQEILYGKTLQKYIAADLIGKTLFDKTSTSVDAVITDQETALDLRLQLEKPVAWLADLPDRLHGHAEYSSDAIIIADMIRALDADFSLSEPFERIRAAVLEARKMGVTKRG